MTELNKKILDMIIQNASVNEISTATGLSNKQLFYRLNMLQIKGYNFSRKYYYNGDITYNLQKDLKQDHRINLITSPKDIEFKCIIISDLHVSSEKERLDLLDYVYNLCIKDGINIIINGGDLINSLIGIKSKHNTIEEQINYLLKKYPYDRNILNFIVFGNHDYNALEISGQNIENALTNKRHDLISLGYGHGELNIKNDKIIIQHPNTANLNRGISSGLLLSGHSHESKYLVNGNLIGITLPPLSDINEAKTFPGFIKATITFTKCGLFNVGTFQQDMFVDNRFYKINESKFELIRGKDSSAKSIKNEEERAPVAIQQVNEKKKNIEINQYFFSYIRKVIGNLIK